jgi:hypothetical protein
LQEQKEPDGKYMATIQRSFEVALKKGEIGEKIIQEYLENLGWIVYFPFTKNKAHYFDLIATKNKEKAVAIDVKTKAKFNTWNAQGINVKSFNEYSEFIRKINIPFYLIFINDKDGDVHLAELANLKNEFYPTSYIIAWPLSEMKLMFNIGKEKIEELSQYDQRTHQYNPVK